MTTYMEYTYFDTSIPKEYVYVEFPEIVIKQHTIINNDKRSSPCDNCPNNPVVNKLATGICHCTLNSPVIY